MRYIGSKARLAGNLAEHIGAPSHGRFIDAFCGTGAVAEVASELGWSVVVNDMMNFAVALSSARLLTEAQTPFSALGGYGETVRLLNKLPPMSGFVTSQYSPRSLDVVGFERRYFTVENAARIDAIRAQIARWSDASRISDLETTLLLADLLRASSRVANTSGTFGCFLSKWTAQSQSDLVIRPRKRPKASAGLQARVGDATTLDADPDDTIYFDPPYTKRQYASYYHILETITLGDAPEVEGVCGLRPWKHKASTFCYKSKATDALRQLIEGTRANRVLLSYSSEGHVGLDDLRLILSSYRSAEFHPIDTIGRYRPNAGASRNGSAVTEYLAVIEKEANASPALEMA